MAKTTSLGRKRHGKPDAASASGEAQATGLMKDWNYIIGIRIFQEGTGRPVARILPTVNEIPAGEPIQGMVCQAARTLLGLSQADLSKAAKVSKKFVNDFENGFRVIGVELIGRLRAALEAEGAQFVTGEDCVGVMTRMSRATVEQRSRSPKRGDQGGKGETGRIMDAGSTEGERSARKRGRPRKPPLPSAA